MKNDMFYHFCHRKTNYLVKIYPGESKKRNKPRETRKAINASHNP